MAKYKIEELEEFDSANHLHNDEACSLYLSEILKEGNTELFLDALGTVAKAQGMTQIAEATGMSRESLYKAFGKGKKPQFETVMKVSRALGMELSFKPATSDDVRVA